MNQDGLAGLHDPRMLADAFSEFISASAVLEASYRELQQEVGQLSVELAARNAALTKSLADNDRMRAVLQQTIESMPCGVMVLNSGEEIVTINPEARRLLGPECAGTASLKALSRGTKIDFSSLLGGAEALHTAEICLSGEGGKRWLAVGKREIGGAAGANTPAQLQSIWILRDITASKHAEEERESARQSMALAEISTILAHEIRNPLASLELFASLLREDGPGNQQWIANLRAGIRTLSGTVNNVLSLNGQAAPKLSPVNLASCVRGGVEFVQPIAEQAGVVLSARLEHDPLMITGNEDGIRQIILNLVWNAIRHTPAGGSIEVTARMFTAERKDVAVLEVQDTGCGISAEAIGQIFEAGFSGTGATPGLGLAVCRRLATQHGGAIRVSSRTGSGSTFHVEFPAL